MSTPSLDNIDERYPPDSIWKRKSIDRDPFENSELSGVCICVSDETFESGILTANCTRYCKVHQVSVQSLDDTTVSAASLDNISENSHVHLFSRSLNTSNMEDYDMSGLSAVCQVHRMNRGRSFQQWRTSRTPCVFLSLLLVGICVMSFSDFATRLVPEVILEKQVDRRPPMINFTTESISFLGTQEILRDVSHDCEKLLSLLSSTKSMQI